MSHEQMEEEHGQELEEMPEHDLRRDLDRISVFARVHPAQKLRIVQAFQAKKKVVARAKPRAKR